MLIPEDNMRNLEELDSAVLDGLNLIGCKTVTDVLRHALVPTLNASEAERQTHEGKEIFSQVITDAHATVGVRCEEK